MPGLEWKCSACGHNVVGQVRCDVCDTLWSPATATTILRDPASGITPRPPGRSRPRPAAARGGLDFGAPTPTPRDPTPGELWAGCGCLLFIAAAVITPIVLLILNWSSVVAFFTGSDSPGSSAPRSPTPSASGPCPKQLAAAIPEGSGAKLVAAYSRDDLEERYAFCRTKSGKLFYFVKPKDGEPYGTPTAAKESKNGYLVRFPSKAYFRFHDGELTAYKDGKENWKEKLIPESSVG